MESACKAGLLGIIQGLTEFLPISSTAHLRIVPALFHWEDPGVQFSAVIQLGTMFAVIIYFWKDLIKIYGDLLRDIFMNRKFTSYESKLGFWILLGTIPICIFGLLFRKHIEEGMARDLNIVAFYLIFFGLILFFSQVIGRQNRDFTTVNILDVLLIGLAQSFALIPGVSRSGVTLTFGLLLGLKRRDAARFSFLLGVPSILASGLLELNTLITISPINNNGFIWFNLLIGVLFSYVSGYFAIDFLLKYLQTHKVHVFVIYRVLLGALIIYLSYNGIIR